MREKPRTAQELERYYRRLLEVYGPQHWWPADSLFEITVGAILTQNTAWRNVERAVAHLKREGLMTPQALHQVSLKRLSETIRPSGTFRIKAGRLKAFVQFLKSEYDGDLKQMISAPPGLLRSKLLSVKGIGPETADSILLYTGDVPIFVIDAYTRRVFSRHRLVDPEASYDCLQRFFMDHLPSRSELYNEYHALLVKVGKEHCKSTPICSGCPLETYLNGKKPNI
ncbi:MAG TPA: endonuclease III domain-containing protein [Nitrospiria bacterium]|nr:endonuclease III domain-containing protein [Nitrospiria bacterium]